MPITERNGVVFWHGQVPIVELSLLYRLTSGPTVLRVFQSTAEEAIEQKFAQSKYNLNRTIVKIVEISAMVFTYMSKVVHDITGIGLVK